MGAERVAGPLHAREGEGSLPPARHSRAWQKVERRPLLRIRWRAAHHPVSPSRCPSPLLLCTIAPSTHPVSDEVCAA